MNTFWECVGLAIVIIAITYSCTHCDRHMLEQRKLQIELKQLEAQP